MITIILNWQSAGPLAVLFWLKLQLKRGAFHWIKTFLDNIQSGITPSWVTPSGSLNVGSTQVGSVEWLKGHCRSYWLLCTCFLCHWFFSAAASRLVSIYQWQFTRNTATELMCWLYRSPAPRPPPLMTRCWGWSTSTSTGSGYSHDRTHGLVYVGWVTSPLSTTCTQMSSAK